jgi:cytochrome b561
VQITAFFEPTGRRTMTDRYTRTAIALHWTVGALVITALCVGWIMTDMAISPLRLRVFDWHKWIGVTVLALFFVRALWRLTHPVPAPLPMPAWQRRSAAFVHGLLYAMLLLQPVTGWLYSNASGRPIVYLGLIPLPNLVDKNRELAHILREIHSDGGVVLAVAIGLHLLAAIKHHFIDRDDTLRRMLRWRAS